MQLNAQGLHVLNRHRPFSTIAELALFLLTSLMVLSLPAGAQANTAAITVNLTFVNQLGQAAAPPSGTAGIQFVFNPVGAAVPAGSAPQTLTTLPNSQGSGFSATGVLQSGTYSVQEVLPPGVVYQNGTFAQPGGTSLPLTNGGTIFVNPGGTYTLGVVNQSSGLSQPGTAVLTVYNTVSSSTGQPSAIPPSGFSFTLTGQNGLPSQTQSTNQAGQAFFTNVPAGVYSLTETPAAGAAFSSMSINGTPAAQGQQFQVMAGGDYEVDVTNAAGGATGAGNVTIQKQIIDQNGNPLPAASAAGITFTITPSGTGFATPTTVTTSSSGLAFANLPAGSYTISENPTSSGILVGYTINGVPTQSGAFTLALGPSTTIVVTNRATGTAGSGLTRVVNLGSGCNNVVDTYPDASPSQTVAGGVVPSAAVISIWRYDNTAQAFRAAYFAPTPGGPPPPVDVSALDRLDPIFICTNRAATFTEPGA